MKPRLLISLSLSLHVLSILFSTVPLSPITTGQKYALFGWCYNITATREKLNTRESCWDANKKHERSISEEHDGDSSGGVDTKPDVVALGLDGDHRQGDLKEEGDSEFTEAVVKEESESWLKEERDDEQEAADDIQGDYGEGKEEVCTGRRRFFMENVQFLAKYALCFSFQH